MYDWEDAINDLEMDEVIKYMKDRTASKIKTADQYLPNKVRLARIEPVRSKAIEYKIDQNDPFNSELKYGKYKTKGNAATKESAADILNKVITQNPNWTNIPKIGDTRKFSNYIHSRFVQGTASPK